MRMGRTGKTSYYKTMKNKVNEETTTARNEEGNK